MGRFFTSLILIGIISYPALAKSVPEAHKHIIEHISVTAMAAKTCPGMTENAVLIVMAAAIHKMDIELLLKSGPYKFLYHQNLAKHKASIKKHGVDIFCTVAWMLYGKDGVNVKGLLSKD